MSSASKWLLLIATTAAYGQELRVCADPDNLPYSNRREAGFENTIAKLVARDLHRPLRFVWIPQRGRYIRDAVKPGLCDLVMGVSEGFQRLETTKPYYRSSYVFVVPPQSPLQPRSFDDPALSRTRIGVHVLPDDGAIAPPAQVLFSHGLGNHIVWYKLYPSFSQRNPPARLIEAVRAKEVDVALAWGPLAGYFAKCNSLRVIPVPHQRERSTPLAFNICMGARIPNHHLVQQLNTIIDRRRSELHRILASYGVPLVPDPTE